MTLFRIIKSLLDCDAAKLTISHAPAGKRSSRSRSSRSCHRVRRVRPISSTRKRRFQHRPSSTALSIGWRSTSGSTGRFPGTRRSASGSTTWRQRTVQAAYLPAASSRKDQYVADSESPSASPPPVLYPTPPAAPPKDDYIPESDSECSRANNYGQPPGRQRSRRAPPAYIFRDGQLMFDKMYQGRQPFTFVDTGLYQGGRHDWYGVHNERDLVWAHRLDRVLKLHNIPRSTPNLNSTAPKQDAGSL